MGNTVLTKTDVTTRYQYSEYILHQTERMSYIEQVKQLKEEVAYLSGIISRQQHQLLKLYRFKNLTNNGRKQR